MRARPSLAEAASPGNALIASWNFLDASIAPNYGGAYPTFTRAGATATRVNSSGLIVSVAADTPRFDYDPVTLAIKGVLIEEARQNLVLPSENFTHANWLGAVVPVADQTTAPDGTGTADKLRQSSGTTAYQSLYATATASASTPYARVVTPIPSA